MNIHLKHPQAFFQVSGLDRAIPPFTGAGPVRLGAHDSGRVTKVIPGRDQSVGHQLPMTDPWCCYIWCAMDPINIPPISVSINIPAPAGSVMG